MNLPAEAENTAENKKPQAVVPGGNVKPALKCRSAEFRNKRQTLRQAGRARKQHPGRNTEKTRPARAKYPSAARRQYSIHPINQLLMIFPAPTPRLVLRAWRDTDLGAFTAMNADPRVMEYFPAPLTPEQSLAFFERIRDEFQTEAFGLYAVERISDGLLLGYTGLHRVTFDGLCGQIEIGWRLRADAWGNGYAAEAARSCLALAGKLGIDEVIAFTTVGNQRSQRVMQKLGMDCVGHFNHPALSEGDPLRRHVLYWIGTK